MKRTITKVIIFLPNNTQEAYEIGLDDCQSIIADEQGVAITTDQRNVSYIGMPYKLIFT